MSALKAVDRHFDRVYRFLFGLRHVDTKHMQDCEDVFVKAYHIGRADMGLDMSEGTQRATQELAKACNQLAKVELALISLVYAINEEQVSGNFTYDRFSPIGNALQAAKELVEE